ncbi:MAG: tetratricopeptide repeat protein, partial [Gemmatimonadales bacterium]
MNRLGFAGLAVLAGCTWSNSLYQARHLTGDALRAEREQRPGEAQQLWGQVVLKADSAYARSPHGARGAEALWLAGNAEARGNNCAQAVPYLERSLFSGPRAPWTQQLLLVLGRCDETIGGPTAASVYDMLLSHTTDAVVRRQARLRRGHVLVLQGQWSQGAAALAGDDTLPARLDRAMALAELGRVDQALTDLGPSLAAADTSVRWINYVEVFATHDSRGADQLLARLLAFPGVTDEQRSAWLLAAAQAATRFDPAAADRRLNQLAARPRG